MHWWSFRESPAPRRFAECRGTNRSIVLGTVSDIEGMWHACAVGTSHGTGEAASEIIDIRVAGG